MKVLCELTDQTVLGQEGRSDKPPRLTARAVLRNAEGKYAVMYAEAFRLYSLPGGGVEAGETVLDALERELLEETGCSCHGIEPSGCVLENRACQDFTQKSAYFAVTTCTKAIPVQLTGPEQASRTVVQWHTWEDMVRLISQPVHDTVQRKYLQARDLAALSAYADRLRRDT